MGQAVVWVCSMGQLLIYGAVSDLWGRLTCGSVLWGRFRSMGQADVWLCSMGQIQIYEAASDLWGSL